MRLPKHSNPQLIPGGTRIVSRRALQLEDDASGDATQDGGAGERMLEKKDVEDLHAELDKIVSKRLKLKRALEPSDEDSSSKRRKVIKERGEGNPEAGHQQDSEPIVFRLVSKQLPPRAIHLSPKPSEVILVGEPAYEDTDKELRERVYRSTLSAVNLKQIKHSFGMINDRKLQRVLQATSWSHIIAVPLLLLVIPRATPIPLNSRVNAQLSPHELNNQGACCPIVSAIPPHVRDASKKGRRRRGKPKNKNKLFP